MDSLRIDAVSERCLVCTAPLARRHFVVPTYLAHDLLYAKQHLEVGLLVNGVRPMWHHVDCADPSLKRYNVLPDIHYCLRCRRQISNYEVIQPVFCVDNPRAVNPKDPTDVGMTFGDRIYFRHVDCTNRQLRDDAALLGP